MHSFGWEAEEAVKNAREQVATLIHADPKEIIWTSGTTESINLALIGVARYYQSKGNHLITSVIEHKAVLETMKYLEAQGFEVTYLPVDSTGLVNPEKVQKAITPKTVLISIMGAHNEIGTIQPIADIGKIAKSAGVFFHVDAAQMCGKIPVDVQSMEVDLLSISAHKVYGPKGIGALYARSRNPVVRLEPLLHGGGIGAIHESPLRPGTLPVQNIVGMGKAFEIAGQEMGVESKRVLGLREKLHKGLMTGILNGHRTQRLPGNLNLSFPGVRSDDLMARVRDIAVSSGSACTSGSHEPSYVIRALGVGDDRARSSIRFGLGRFTTEEEIDFAVEKFTEALRLFSRACGLSHG